MKIQYLLQYTVDGKAHYLSNDSRELMAGFVRCILTRKNTFNHKLFTPSYGVAAEIDVYDFCMNGEVNFIRSVV